MRRKHKRQNKLEGENKESQTPNRWGRRQKSRHVDFRYLKYLHLEIKLLLPTIKKNFVLKT